MKARYNTQKEEEHKMKRYGNLYTEICSIENLRLAHKNARKGKTYYPEVIKIDKDPDKYLIPIQKMLQNKSYFTSKYRIFEIVDRGKRREICDLPYYPDRIVHWALIQIIEPILMKHLIETTYAALPGRGTHKALRKMRRYMDDRNGTAYCLKIDVSKYFPNIDKEILKNKFRKRIKCPDTLWLIDEIIDSFEKGIPIGNYTSQYFGNYYLSDFDHWIKEEKKIKYYLRYMDDMIFFAPTKEELHDLIRDIHNYLGEELHLSVKPNWQVFPTAVRGVDFVGYRTFYSYTLLRKSTKKRLKRASKKLLSQKSDGIPFTASNISTIASYMGLLKWCNSYRLYLKTLYLLERPCNTE
jgi:RNA-directed DNA polymerase